MFDIFNIFSLKRWMLFCHLPKNHHVIPGSLRCWTWTLEALRGYRSTGGTSCWSGSPPAIHTGFGDTSQVFLNRRDFWGRGVAFVTPNNSKNTDQWKENIEDWVFLWIPSPFKTCFGKHQSTGMESLPHGEQYPKFSDALWKSTGNQIHSSLGCHHFGWFLVHRKTQTSTNQAFPGFWQPSGVQKVKPTPWRMYSLYDGSSVRTLTTAFRKMGHSTWKSKFLKMIQIDLDGWPSFLSYSPFWFIFPNSSPWLHRAFSNLWQAWFVAWVQTPAQFLF